MKTILMYTLLCVLTAFLVLTFFSCNSQSTQPEISISGTLADSESNDPLSNITITCNPGSLTTVTDQNGNFTFSDLSSGTYTIEITASWYRDTSIEDILVGDSDPDEILTISLESICPIFPPQGPVDSFDPQYQVVYPNGGEIFHIGDVCSVKVTSAVTANAYIGISIDNGITYHRIREETASFNPKDDSLHIFTIPTEFTHVGPDTWNDQTQTFDTLRISTISDFCWIRLIDYDKSDYVDFSDCYFAIRE